MYTKIIPFVKSSTRLESLFEGDDSVTLSLSLSATIRDRRQDKNDISILNVFQTNELTK